MRYALHAAAVLVGGLSLSPLAFAAPDWTSVPATTIHVFHPGVTPWEWIESKGKHGGSRGLSRGESCAGCHVENGEINVGEELRWMVDFDEAVKRGMGFKVPLTEAQRASITR